MGKPPLTIWGAQKSKATLVNWLVLKDNPVNLLRLECQWQVYKEQHKIRGTLHLKMGSPKQKEAVIMKSGLEQNIALVVQFVLALIASTLTFAVSHSMLHVSVPIAFLITVPVLILGAYNILVYLRLATKVGQDRQPKV